MVKRLLNKLKKKYMNLSIKYKMLIFFYSIIIGISSVLGTYSYMLASNNIRTEISETSLTDVKQIGNSIGSLKNDIADLSNFTITSKEVQAVLSSADPYKSEKLSICTQMFDHLLISKNAISFVAIYGDNGFQYYSSADGSSDINNLAFVMQSSLYKKMLDLKGQPLWVSLNVENQVFIINNKNPKVAMCRTLYDSNSLKKLGVMVICININYLEEFYTNTNIDSNRSLFLLDSDNKIINYKNLNTPTVINEKDIAEITKGLKEEYGKASVHIGIKDMMLSYTNIENSNWKLVNIIPYTELTNNLKSIFQVTLLVIISCLFISFLISIYISTNLTSPIKTLLKAMKNVAKVDFKYGDEIGILGNQYNEMLDSISNLIEKVYKLQLKEKEAELKALQAQINPHFLYNTLDTIFWRAEMAKEKEISEMVYALSKLFRLTLNNGEETTYVKDEKEFIEYYLLLQKSRYKDKLTYKIDIEERILNYTIPKLILQPFVENAILYGTENDLRQSCITIKGYLEDKKINFSIEDNGMGISQEKIKDLLNMNSKAAIKKGYAINNINQRLNLYYDKNYKLDIYSEIGKGTIVKIVIPTNIKKMEEGS
ncbi:MAG TPA: sensor histidine kinase [Clostridiaceae bacterium]